MVVEEGAAAVVPLVCSDWMMERNGLKYISVSISLICVRDEI
jgi:hypothetical protein